MKSKICLVILLISFLVSAVPTIFMIFNRHDMDGFEVRNGRLVTCMKYKLRVPKRAVIGNVIAWVVLFILLIKEFFAPGNINVFLMNGVCVIVVFNLIVSCWYDYRYTTSPFNWSSVDAFDDTKITLEEEGKSCEYMAQISGIEKNRFLLKDVYVWVDGGWFPYCYPCCRSEIGRLPLYGIERFQKLGIREGDRISFSAVSSLNQSDNALNFSLKKCRKFEIFSYTTLKQPKANLCDSWLHAEKLVCMNCKYSKGCHNGIFPCIVQSKENCGWNRSLLMREYPELFEKQTRVFNTGIPCLNVVPVSVPKRMARELGFQEKSVVVIFDLIESSMHCGARIRSVDGHKISTTKQLDQILLRHKVGECITVVTDFANQESVEHTVTLLASKEAAKLMFGLMPFRIAGDDVSAKSRT